MFMLSVYDYAAPRATTRRPKYTQKPPRIKPPMTAARNSVAPWNVRPFFMDGAGMVVLACEGCGAAHRGTKDHTFSPFFSP